MTRLVDMAGQRFGRLLVLHRDGTKCTYATWRVRCDCGVEKTIMGSQLRRGATRSCGCSNAAEQSARSRTHGMTNALTYSTWRSMISRCEEPRSNGYENYGGRGVTICTRWRASFEAFLEDMGERPSRRHSIERKDVNGHYEPGNCRWATVAEQVSNRRSNRRITYDGRTQTVAQWAREVGMRRNTLRRRLDAGWSVHDALFAPKDLGNRWNGYRDKALGAPR